MNLDQTTLTHIAIGAVVVFLLLRHLGWQKPTGPKPPPGPPTAPAAGWWAQYPPYAPPPPPASNGVAFDIPNLPVKAIITLQPEGTTK
jgi:hypothetical protein